MGVENAEGWAGNPDNESAGYTAPVWHKLSVGNVSAIGKYMEVYMPGARFAGDFDSGNSARDEASPKGALT